MTTSILHRMSGAALYFAALVAAAWAVSLASGPEAYDAFMGVLGSPLGKLVMLGLSAATFYHLANGIRHLVWDFGHGLDVKSASASSWAVFAFTVAATVAAWAVAYMTGALA